MKRRCWFTQTTLLSLTWILNIVNFQKTLLEIMLSKCYLLLVKLKWRAQTQPYFYGLLIISEKLFLFWCKTSRIVMASKNTWVELDWWKIYRIILFWHSTKTLVKVRWTIWKINTIAWIKYICICRIIQFDLVLFFESDTVYYTPFINNKFEQMGILFKKQLVVSAAALIYFFVWLFN